MLISSFFVRQNYQLANKKLVKLKINTKLKNKNKLREQQFLFLNKEIRKISHNLEENLFFGLIRLKTEMINYKYLRLKFIFMPKMILNGFKNKHINIFF